ncbi:MAG TPA: HAMP domain-containing sensor histidine kinase [Vicinamibacterales bacterium]|nr:HAMP domain-containing sensor histidine kinase [Vicinamibacterales bacterium]
MRPWPLASTVELENGVPLFLTVLSEALRLETTATPFSSDAIGDSAARLVGHLLKLGFSVSQVVHDYGDICQAITELAFEQNAPITVEEFHTLNRCLDNAIAEALIEPARLTAQSRSTDDVERLGELTQELRNMLNTALLAFHTLKRGSVGVNGNTGAVLGRALVGLQALVESRLSDIRVTANQQRRERLAVISFLNDVSLAGSLDAELRGQQFVIESVDPELAVDADTQLLGSAVMNLLTNAFKYTRAGGRVVLRAYREDTRLLIEVEDECGGIPDDNWDPYPALGEQRGHVRIGLGLGLSIARKAVKAHGGDIQTRNLPGKGCVFVIDVPLAAEEMPLTPALE